MWLCLRVRFDPRGVNFLAELKDFLALCPQLAPPPVAAATPEPEAEKKKKKGK